MKKRIAVLLAAILAICTYAVAEIAGEITVISREDGSGTRGAFIELLGIEKKDENGVKADYTTDEAIITNSTNIMMTSVAGDEASIGYISLGSLNDTVKAIAVDGVMPSAEAVKNGDYKVARPFNIATGADANDLVKDFISFILSAEGQSIVEKNGYVAVKDDAEAYVSNDMKGTITIGGSSSVTPIMEKLAEVYMELNPKVTVDVQQSDSTTGMNAVRDGIVDIGMASRDLKESELKAGLNPIAIAMDGIAIIVNHENSVENLSAETVCAIYTGEITDWAEVN